MGPDTKSYTFLNYICERLKSRTPGADLAMVNHGDKSFVHRDVTVPSASVAFRQTHFHLVFISPRKKC